MKSLIFLAAMVAAMTSQAAPSDCYEATGLVPFRPQPAREIVLAFDETTVLPPSVASDFKRWVTTNLAPGDQITVILFSTFSRDRYLRVFAELQVPADPDPASVKNMPMNRARDLTDCLTSMRSKARSDVSTAIDQAASQASPEISRSELLASLREIGPRLQTSAARRKVLVLVTDGIEHSEIADFYENRNLRLINVDAELAKKKVTDVIAKLAGATVYIYGGGLAANSGFARESPALLALETFWLRHVTASGGQLVAFGKPTILEPLK